MVCGSVCWEHWRGGHSTHVIVWYVTTWCYYVTMLILCYYYVTTLLSSRDSQPGPACPLGRVGDMEGESHPAKKGLNHGLGAQAGEWSLELGPGSLSSWLLGSMSPQARPCCPRAHGGRNLGFYPSRVLEQVQFPGASVSSCVKWVNNTSTIHLNQLAFSY